MNIFAQTILGWYRTHQRELPWRNISDPYLIWVSEIILQQTRVEQGYAYYLRFVQRFPNIQSLAEASEDEVLKVWQGLGYYSRARNMQAAAQQMMRDYEGQFPKSYEEIRGLKGVGDYTAAAVSTFAYHLPYAVVDGNVYRVLARYFGVDLPIDAARGKKYFAQLAKDLLPTQHVADYNQGIMDFGALQCVPSRPQCEDCPLVEGCKAHGENKVECYPVKSHKTKVQQRYFTYVFVSTPKGVWLHRREGDNIWKGLYEPLLIESDHPLALNEIRKHPNSSLLPKNGTWMELKKSVKHVLSHRLIMADFYQFFCEEPLVLPADYRVVPYADLAEFAMPQLINNQLHLLRTTPI